LQTRESITQDIRAASDIAGVIGQFVSLKPIGQGFRGLCPFHREKTPSFYVRPAEQYFKCFGCGKAGDVFTFIMEHDSVSFPEARQILADRAGIEIKPSSAGGAKPGIGRRDIFRANQWAMDLFRRELLGSAGGPAREYVASRKISEAMAEQFKVGFAPDSYDFLRSRSQQSGVPDDLLLAAGLIKRADDGDYYDTFRHRLIFPIVDPTERIVGFGGRALGGQSAKYINSPETAVFHKSQCLYGMNHARSALKDRERAVLVEGYTDVIMAHQHGFAETVAPLGTSLTEGQSDMLRRYSPCVVVVFDADPAGRKAADRAAEIAMKSHLDVLLAVMPDGTDPCEFLSEKTPADFEELLISAKPALLFKWEITLREHQGGGTPAARLRAVTSFIEFVAFSDVFGSLGDIERGLAIDQLARLVGIRRESVCEQIEEARRRNRPPQVETAGAKSKPARTRPRDALEAAVLDALIVLVCEPGLFDQAKEWFDPRLFIDEQLRRIAEATVVLAGETGEFSVNELIEKLESSDDAARIVDLVEQGRSGGPLEDRLAAAAERMTALSAARESHRAQQQWSSRATDHPASSEEDRDQNLAKLFDRTKEYASAANFAGIRKIKMDTTHY